ncbi:MAG: VOC family protein [Promethearchaeota archaeon]|jgi:catechol 2,3-dioxygenase-like lactoylglutathione lyase family enzyme
MFLKITSIFVNDQEKALRFYTDVLGFIKKQDIPVGKFRWLTVVSPEGPDDLELLLEPNDNPIAKEYQNGLFNEGIPAAAFFTNDVKKEYEHLRAQGVTFSTEPSESEGGVVAIFDDSCGNLISLNQLQ